MNGDNKPPEDWPSADCWCSRPFRRRWSTEQARVRVVFGVKVVFGLVWLLLDLMWHMRASRAYLYVPEGLDNA